MNEIITINHPSIIIRVAQKYHVGLSPVEVYDIVRGRWKVDINRARKANYALAVHEGLVIEVYEILNWYEGGATFSTRYDEGLYPGRYEFIGNIAIDEIRDQYLGRSVAHYFEKGASNPIMYVGLDDQ